MKTILKRSILILLITLLLVGAARFGPQLCFALDLYMGWYSSAETVYLSHLSDTDQQREEAAERIRVHLDQKMDRYYKGELSYDEVMTILTDMALFQPFSTEANRRIQQVEEMEAARNRLAQADACYTNGDYADAIPLYRQSLMADESAAYRLEQAEIQYVQQLLGMAQADMAKEDYSAAAAVLSEGLALLDEDEDLTAAMADVQRMQADQLYRRQTEEAQRRLNADGPEAALGYVAELRLQAPDAYALEYLEQIIRRACEDDICTRASALREEGDDDAACALLEDGLRLIESVRMKALLHEIRGAHPVWLNDLTISRDETASARTGAISSVALDQVVSDSLSNEYTHSLSANLGSVTFSLGGAFIRFTGTIAFPAGEASDTYRASATLQVFADGRMLSEFKSIDSNSAPLPFSLPVSGVNELTLTWTSQGANGWQDWGQFATLFDGKLLCAEE